MLSELEPSLSLGRAEGFFGLSQAILRLNRICFCENYAQHTLRHLSDKFGAMIGARLSPTMAPCRLRERQMSRTFLNGMHHIA